MKKATEGSDRSPIHRCIRCGRYRFDNEMWETATLRSGGSGYMDEIESICLRCAPKVQELMQEAEVKKIIESERLRRFVTGVRTGRIPSAPLEEPKPVERVGEVVVENIACQKAVKRLQAEKRLTKGRSTEKSTTCTYPAAGQIWEAVSPYWDACAGFRCVIAEVRQGDDTVMYKWVTGTLQDGHQYSHTLRKWSEHFKYIIKPKLIPLKEERPETGLRSRFDSGWEDGRVDEDKPEEEEDILRKLW